MGRLGLRSSIRPEGTAHSLAGMTEECMSKQELSLDGVGVGDGPGGQY